MNNETLHCGELMKRINDNLEKHANSELQAHGVTASQSYMLRALYIVEGGASTLKRMEKYFDAAQSTVAGIAARLEKKGLIESYTDADDKRIKRIKITKEGIALFESIKKSMIATESHFLSALSDDEKIEFEKLLDKIYKSMQ